ncbi:hypothetical protein HZA42_00765 [Candidatus Peregrinibacteria bacterium]|nr:hypothetical protein [Candidatus Peregrinibacteria bacterium]
MTAIAVFVPLSPAMPAANLDSAWSFGLNQSVAQGLSFGKEIIFTFGPYTSIYTRAYNPSTDFIMLLGSICLALSYWACCALLIKGVKWYWILSFCFFGLASLTYNRDVLLFSYPLLVGLVCFKNAHNGKFSPYYFAILFASLGLLPLVKGNTLILCAAIEVLCLVFFIVNKQTRLALVALLTSLVSMLFFWSLSGQSVANLPDYFINMAPIISGFTEAMAVNGSTREIVFYLITAISLLIVISIQRQINVISKIFLFCIYFCLLPSRPVLSDTVAVMSSSPVVPYL